LSHMVRGTTNFTCENKDVLIEALKEAYEGAEVLENTAMTYYGQCDIVLRRKGGRDIGFKQKADGTYECLAYEPGSGSGQSRINSALKPVYEPYVKGVATKMMKSNPNLRDFIMQKPKEVERNGKKMKRIRIQAGGGSSGGYI
jgi:hypothetical protein